MRILVLRHQGLDLSGLPKTDDIVVVQFAAVAAAIASLNNSIDAAVFVSDGCSDEVRASLAPAIRALDRRVIEVQGTASAKHGAPLSAACTGVIAGFGLRAGVRAAIAVLSA